MLPIPSPIVWPAYNITGLSEAIFRVIATAGILPQKVQMKGPGVENKELAMRIIDLPYYFSISSFLFTAMRLSSTLVVRKPKYYYTYYLLSAFFLFFGLRGFIFLIL